MTTIDDIRAEYEQARGSWEGLEWDDDGVTWLQVLAQGQSPDPDMAPASYADARDAHGFRERARRLAHQLQDVRELATGLLDEYLGVVEQAARRAEEAAALALECVQEGDAEGAETAATDACALERRCGGDCPTWGRFLDLIRAWADEQEGE